jgi:hypothetical protein
MRIETGFQEIVITIMRLVPAFLALAIHLTPASADTIVSTFGPSDSYSTGGGADISRYMEQAMPFAIPTTSSYLLDGIAVAVSTGSAQSNTTINFDVMTDSGGLPGEVLESFSFSDVTANVFSGEIVNGTSVPRPRLVAGETYWLAASSPGDISMYWHLAPTEDIPRALRLNSGPWELHDGEDPLAAFRVSGTAVPEPASLALASIGLLGPLAWGWRRRQ